LVDRAVENRYGAEEDGEGQGLVRIIQWGLIKIGNSFSTRDILGGRSDQKREKEEILMTYKA